MHVGPQARYQPQIASDAVVLRSKSNRLQNDMSCFRAEEKPRQSYAELFN